MGSRHGRGTRRYQADRKAFKVKCEKVSASCWLCGQSINYSLPWLDPITGKVNKDAFELDHMFPVSTHPELAEDPGNYRPAHHSCNNQRSNKKPRGGLGSLSRHWVT